MRGMMFCSRATLDIPTRILRCRRIDQYRGRCVRLPGLQMQASLYSHSSRSIIAHARHKVATTGTTTSGSTLIRAHWHSHLLPKHHHKGMASKTQVVVDDPASLYKKLSEFPIYKSGQFQSPNGTMAVSSRVMCLYSPCIVSV
jgi:hypothetical protein